VSTPNLVTFQTSVTNVYRNVLTTSNVTTLQAIITLANLFRDINRPEPFTLCREAAILSQKLLTTRHIVTMQMVTIFLELTSQKITESKTEIMVKREDMLLVLVECYKIHYGNTSEKVLTVMQQLVEHYHKTKDTQKLQAMITTIQTIISTEYGSGSTGTSGSLDVRLVGRGHPGGKGDGESGYLLNLDLTEEDELIESTDTYEVEALIQLADKYLKSGRVDLAERTYVEFWQRATRESRLHSSAVWEEKKMKVVLAYSNFLRVQKREHESSSVLTSFWQDYHHSSISLSETTVTHLQEIAKVMTSVGLSTTALSVFKQCSEYYQSTRSTETSSYKEVQQLLQTTTKEVCLIHIGDF
jgi:hypothetical protein